MTRTHASRAGTTITQGRSVRPLTTLAVTAALALASVGCSHKTVSDDTGEIAKASEDSPKSASRVSACALMPVEEMNDITGNAYTTAKAEDDGRSSQTSCHYESPTNPAGATLGVQWIRPSEYSNPVEHAALQKAALGGATAAGKVMGGMGGGVVGGMASGPVDSVGDEATMSMMLLTARKGDYVIMVQIIPTNMMAVMTDSTVALALVAKEKTIARRVLAKV